MLQGDKKAEIEKIIEGYKDKYMSLRDLYESKKKEIDELENKYKDMEKKRKEIEDKLSKISKILEVFTSPGKGGRTIGKYGSITVLFREPAPEPYKRVYIYEYEYRESKYAKTKSGVPAKYIKCYRWSYKRPTGIDELKEKLNNEIKKINTNREVLEEIIYDKKRDIAELKEKLIILEFKILLYMSGIHADNLLTLLKKGAIDYRALETDNDKVKIYVFKEEVEYQCYVEVLCFYFKFYDKVKDYVYVYRFNNIDKIDKKYYLPDTSP